MAWRRTAWTSLMALIVLAGVARADISRFVGSFEGAAPVTLADGRTQDRVMNVKITETKAGFSVAWTTTTLRADGTGSDKSYLVEFVPSDRGDVFAAAMKRNVFGHGVQLDPMQGEPYVWARIEGDTLSVYSLFVAEDGGYEIQQFDRTLADGGLDLEYQSVRNGEIGRTVSTFLRRR